MGATSNETFKNSSRGRRRKPGGSRYAIQGGLLLRICKLNLHSYATHRSLSFKTLNTFSRHSHLRRKPVGFPKCDCNVWPDTRHGRVRSSPIYMRDVEKLDRQDNNAATRLFCADTLEWLQDHHPEQLGLAAYLFIFGELIDAWQNRSISILERV